MLGQIERGQSSPTINVLWKISTGLKIPLSFFYKQQETEYTVANLDEENVITEVIRRFLDAYGQHMEFCQIQLNYMDWHFQNAQEKVAILQKAGIPVWVMEPLRGRKACKGFRRIGGNAAFHVSEGNGSRLGLPFPAERSKRNDGVVRHIQYGAIESQYCYL